MRWRIGVLVVASLLPMAAMSADKARDAKLRDAMAHKYPAAQIVAWCAGGTLARPGEAVAALRDDQTFRVVWAGKNGAMREVDSVAAANIVGDFELQCLSPRDAKDRIKVLRESEGIRQFLKVPAGKGAFCYFIDATETRCWSFDGKGNLLNAGGWQT